ncbi:hypothetical protein AB9U01_29400, partial [Pseudomonas qingdaonensis]|uniref:hypothetical protein n=1 Tax=Pseudomonas qingdaonensis TaxID=2056231 RepID=UPI003517C7FC
MFVKSVWLSEAKVLLGPIMQSFPKNRTPFPLFVRNYECNAAFGRRGSVQHHTLPGLLRGPLQRKAAPTQATRGALVRKMPIALRDSITISLGSENNNDECRTQNLR